MRARSRRAAGAPDAAGRDAHTTISAARADPDLAALARIVGQDWVDGPYYEAAEAEAERHWADLIWPFIAECDFTRVVEVAAGRGRISERLRQLTTELYLVDINVENIEFLRRRFRAADNIRYVHNSGIDLDEIPDARVSLVCSFDAMVHFDSDVVRAYLREFARVLRPGGSAFCHYSNFSGDPTGSYRDHPGWRNFMSKELFEHYAVKEGLLPVRSEVLDWALDGTDSDAMTLVRKQ